jgi:POT family proton-dependent oligopeptide transporter
MRAMLVLYMAATVTKGGLGFTEKDAIYIYGIYVTLVYIMAIPGGIIADKLLGQRKSVMVGGLLLCAGHGLMANPAKWAFFTALSLIILGVGLLKPNISTMVGGLYENNPEGKDSGFTIFYMGINLGALIAGIIVGALRVNYGWHWGFGAAGIGMVLGQIVYIWGQKYLGDVGHLIKKESKIDAPKAPLSKKELRKLFVILISFGIVLIFWAAFEQAGGLMNLYTEKYTDRNFFSWEIPTEFFQSLNPFYIMIFAPIVAAIWLKLAKKGKEPSSIFKMGLGNIILGIGFIFMVGASLERGGGITPGFMFLDNPAKSGMSWLMLAYLFHTLGELALSPVALSFITKMAPKKMTSSVMGLYFAVTGLGGGALAAFIGILAKSKGELMIFSGIAIFTIIFGIMVMLATKKINSIAKEV